MAARVGVRHGPPISHRHDAVGFNAAEWARLAAIFPSGVCDGSRRGVYQTEVVPDGSFGPRPRNLVYDITQAR